MSENINSKTYYYNVKNRSAGVIVYTIPEDNIRRRFAIGETKRISYDELLKLSNQPGGREMMANFLQIKSDGVLQTLGIHKEPEYDMSEEQIIELIKNGSLEAFLDCLDYAPTGVIELVKKYAVSIPLSDLNKRKALEAKTGFNVDKAIENSGKESTEIEEAKLQAQIATPATGRRTNSNYKVVEQK